MKKSRPGTAPRLFTARAPLAALGLKLRSLKIFETIPRHVEIKQKTIKHTPIEKLTDAFIAILSGAHGLSEINTRVRSDTAVQRAFGRTSCAEQSVVQETLDACTQTTCSRCSGHSMRSSAPTAEPSAMTTRPGCNCWTWT